MALGYAETPLSSTQSDIETNVNAAKSVSSGRDMPTDTEIPASGYLPIIFFSNWVLPSLCLPYIPP
jgi:hypothetical protein